MSSGRAFFLVVAVAAVAVAAIVAFGAGGSTGAAHAQSGEEPQERHGAPQAEVVRAADGTRVAAEHSPVVPVGAGVKGAKVRVHARDSQGRGVSGVLIACGGSASQVTSEAGDTEFDIAPGRYSITVDPESLAGRYVVPPMQHLARPEHVVPVGFYPLEVVVLAGGEADVEVLLFASARVFGFVVDADSAPLEGVSVQLQSRQAGLAGLSVNGTSDLAGKYEFEGVAPGAYFVRFFREGAHSGPVPILIQVVEGSNHAVDTAVLGGGTGVVRGRVRDASGGACAQVRVIAYPATPEDGEAQNLRPFTLADVVGVADTDANGVFAIHDLPSAPLLVQVNPWGLVWPHGKLLKHSAPLEVFPKAGGSLELGDVTIHFAQPFKAVLNVTVDEAECRRVDPTLPKALSLNVYVVEEPNQHDRAKWRSLRMLEGGGFEHSWLPRDGAMVFIAKVGVLPAKTRLVVPRRDGSETIAIQYP